MKQQTLRRIRQYHLYLGVFFAPAIVLFSLSGALQTFRLQDKNPLGGKPNAAIVWMASFHKDQRLPHEKPKRAVSAATAKPVAEPVVPKPNTLPLQIFVTLLSIALIASTILGLTIALTSRATRRISFAMLAVGTTLPLALLLV
ncbi:hypothetical protein ACVWZA_001717 [Sphingomonas sp. UYAg733]